MNTLDNEQLIDWGRQVLLEESTSLENVAKYLDDSFSEVVRDIISISGKVILTGMGKSGHIARKIASTLSSTGTPSFFLHPSEALHGDFGMIDKNDIIIAIAFQGETREVLEVCKFAHRIGIKVVAICGKQNSSLADLSDYFLDGRIDKEACPLNLAPTSSAIVSLAIGDALGVALMKARGFEEKDFAKLHPEGSLGRKLSIVTNYMRPLEDISLAKQDDNFHEVLEKVTKNNFGITTIVSESSDLMGVITDGDLRRALKRCEGSVFSLSASDLMTSKPKVVSQYALAVDAFKLMESNNITAICVVESEESNKLVGIVRMYDLLAAKIV